jgi:hypothetical protein
LSSNRGVDGEHGVVSPLDELVVDVRIDRQDAPLLTAAVEKVQSTLQLG